MKWQQLTEKGETSAGYVNSSMEFDEILEKYSVELKESALARNPMVRGMKSVGEFGFGDGSKMNRQSKNTNNYYTLIVDNDPSWKDYPKRSKSFICSTYESYATSFGIPYVVIPLENQTIGVCPNEDFWDSFSILPSAINSLIAMIGKRILGRNVEELNYNQLKYDLEVIYDAIRDGYESTDLEILTNDYGYDKSVPLWDWYVDKLNPTKNEFVHTTDVKNLPTDREVWLSGKVLFVQMIQWRKIVAHFKNQNI